MDPDLYLPVVLPVLALLATNAFFVTAESALLTVPRGRQEAGSRDPGRRRPGLIGIARPDEVLTETFDLFCELEAHEHQLDFPTIYTIAKHGIAKRSLSDDSTTLSPLLETIVDHAWKWHATRR